MNSDFRSTVDLDIMKAKYRMMDIFFGSYKKYIRCFVKYVWNMDSFPRFDTTQEDGSLLEILSEMRSMFRIWSEENPYFSKRSSLKIRTCYEDFLSFYVEVDNSKLNSYDICELLKLKNCRKFTIHARKYAVINEYIQLNVEKVYLGYDVIDDKFIWSPNSIVLSSCILTYDFSGLVRKRLAREGAVFVL